MTTLQKYKNRLRESRNYSEPQWERAVENYEHYLSKLRTSNDSGDYPFNSKMTVPISYDIVETILPRFIGRDPEFSAVAVEPSDVAYEQQAKLVIEMEYNNPKLEMMGEPIYLKLLKGVKEALITGNAVLRPYWRRNVKKQIQYVARLERAKKEGNPNEIYAMAKKMQAEDEVTFAKKVVDSPVIDDFDIRHLPFFHFFPDVPMIETGRMRYKIERDYMTWDELQAEAEIFGYDKKVMSELKELTDNNENGFTPDVSKDFQSQYNDLFGSVNDVAFDDDSDKIALFAVDKMWEGSKVHVFVNEKYQLTPEEGMDNPYDVMQDPFIFVRDVLIPHSYFARSELDWIKRLEDGVTDLYNMRYDNLLQSMLNIWLYNPNYIADGDEFIPIPNTLTAVRDVEKSVRVISGQDVTGNTYQEAQTLTALSKETAGINDYVKGLEGDTIAGRTYGGLRLVQEAANARFIVKARTFEKTTLKALGYFILEMSRQFIDKPRYKRLSGDLSPQDEQFATIHPDKLKSIKGFMDIKVVPNSSMQLDQQAEAMRLNAVADRMMAGKGPFENIPPSVYDKFLLKYLQVNGINDAVYWVREIQKAREEVEKQAKEQPQPSMPVPQAQPPLPQQQQNPQELAGVMPPEAMPQEQVMQSNGISNQPSPLAQLLANS